MSSSIKHLCIALANSKEDFESAFTLLENIEASDSGNWLNKFHALPSTSTIVAKADGKVVGALVIYGESLFRLPLEAQYDLAEFRSEHQGRMAELSSYAIVGDHAEHEEIMHALLHYAVSFSSNFCHYDQMITKIPAECEDYYRDHLGFKRIITKEAQRNGILMGIDVPKVSDYHPPLKVNFNVEFAFPEKRFFLVNHRHMSPDLLHYFFNIRSSVFSRLNDLELRAFRNIYHYGQYMNILPERKVNLDSSKLPKHKRFDMCCEGFLTLPDQRKVHFHVLDVSAKGIKVETEAKLDVNAVFMMNISIGVMRDTEVIAKAIWTKADSNQVGLEVQSSDENWKKLINYLEKDFHPQAA